MPSDLGATSTERSEAFTRANMSSPVVPVSSCRYHTTPTEPSCNAVVLWLAEYSVGSSSVGALMVPSPPTRATSIFGKARVTTAPAGVQSSVSIW